MPIVDLVLSFSFGKILIKDLRRPSNWKAAVCLSFAKHVLRYSPNQLRMYGESLGAALTLQEVQKALRRSKLISARLEKILGLDFVIAT